MFEKLQKRKGAKSAAVKVMTIDQVYEQNQKVLKKEAEEEEKRKAEEERLKKEEEEMRKKMKKE